MKKGWLRHLDFILVDNVVTEVSLLFVYVTSVYMLSENIENFWQLYFLLPLVNLFACIVLDNYNGILQRGYLKEFVALLKMELLIFAILIFLFYYLQLGVGIPQSILVFYFLIDFPLTYGGRFFHKFYLYRRYNKVKHTRQIVVATTEDAAKKLIRTITQSAIRNYQFFGLVILDRTMIGEQIEHIAVSADRDTLIDFVKENIVDEVFISIPNNSCETLNLAKQLLQMGITVHIYMEDAYQELPNRSISNVFGFNVLTTTISPISFQQLIVKRIMDLVGGVAGSIIALLLCIIIGPVIYIKSPGPIIFTQIRVGKQGRPFKIYKFRSMYMDAEERKQELVKKNKIVDGLMFKIDDDPRIIKGIGRFIRKTSIDEFPQFWNVLKGDMSMVGTRPPTLDEYQHYSPYHKRRLTMLPGITGLWQVSGRSRITNFEEVVRLDTEYIENWSIELDIKIILKTVIKVIHNEDAY